MRSMRDSWKKDSSQSNWFGYCENQRISHVGLQEGTYQW